jgi:hypothetical protein
MHFFGYFHHGIALDAIQGDPCDFMPFLQSRISHGISSNKITIV